MSSTFSQSSHAYQAEELTFWTVTTEDVEDEVGSLSDDEPGQLHLVLEHEPWLSLIIDGGRDGARQLIDRLQRFVDADEHWLSSDPDDAV